MSTIFGWIQAMGQGRAPSLPKSEENEFYKEVLPRLVLFARFAKGDTVKIGREAVEAMMQKASAETVLSLEDLKPFARFSFLLNDEEKKKVREWTAKLTAGMPSMPTGPSSSASSSKPSVDEAGKGQGKKRKASDEQVLRAATKALFKS